MPESPLKTDSASSAPQEAAGGSTAQDNTEIVQKVLNDLRRMRFFRRQYDSKRAYFYKQYVSQRDQRLYPDNITPRSNTFVPYALSNVETITSRVMDTFFSLEDWFESKPRALAYEDASGKMQKVLTYLLRRSNFICAFEDLIRNITIYGHAGIKVDWDHDFEIVTYPKPIFLTDPETGEPIIDPQTGQPFIQQVVPDTKAVPKLLPRFTVIDVYDLLIDPDSRVTAHVTERSWGQLKREAQAKPDLYFPEALTQIAQRIGSRKNPDDIIIRFAEIWDETNNTWTILTFGEDADALAWKDLRASFRSASYKTWKREVLGGTPILMWHGANPFLHKRSPILHTSFIKLPNEVFGLGAIEIISDLNEALNRIVNMIMDNWNLGINRRYAYDVNADIDHEALNNFNVPGGKVGVSGNPSDMVFPLPVFTPSAQDYVPLELFKNMIEMSSGISDFYGKAVGSPEGNKTATGIAQVINESNFRFRMFIRNLELDILQPMLEMCASMVQQYINDPIEISITGEAPGIPKTPLVTPEELIGTFSFDLVAANYATNKFVRQRNMMALSNILAQSQYVNEFEAIKELAKIFEIPNITKLLKSPEQVAAEQQAALRQQIQMMLLQHALDVDAKVRTASARSGGKEGRPAKAQFEGKIPGAGITSLIRDLAQGMGANANSLGLEGMGEVPNAE